jgi:hypothetical protein
LQQWLDLSVSRLLQAAARDELLRVLAPLASVGAAAGDARLLRPPARRHPRPRQHLRQEGILCCRPGTQTSFFMYHPLNLNNFFLSNIGHKESVAQDVNAN